LPETGIEIEGIDALRGLAMTGGTVEGYIKVLELYCRDADKRIEIFSSVPDKSGLAAFITQVHALKSASASIGAAEISGEAKALELAGSRGDMEYIREHLGAFRENLAKIIERIKTALSSKTAAASGGKDHDIGASLNLLKNALASENVGDADRLISDLSGKPLDETTKNSLSDIADLVLVGEFNEALAAAEKLADALRDRKNSDA
jgi:HPt (histidine-containing phosphotransfer) domain-containing protein